MDKKLAIVTGGAGFVGTHLCKRLLNDGFRVVSLDNYFSGTKENHIDGVEYIEGHTKDISKLITEKPDIIYHLGEYSRVAASLDEPDVVFDLNMVGTSGVLEFWRKHKCKLVYAGSSTKSVGDRGDGVEGRDLAPYTWAKATNTELVVNYSKWFDLQYAITYFYNVYGGGERTIENHGTIIETFRVRMKNGEPLLVRSPGTQTRSFTHIDDTIDGIILVGEKGEGDNFGISAKEEYTLLEVAEMFGGTIEMLPPTKTTRPHSVVDSSKVKKLGWRQKEKLEDYIKKTK